MDVPTMWSGEEKIADVKSSIGLRLMRHNSGFDFGKLRQEPLIPACTQHCRQSVRMCGAPHQQSVRTLSVQSKTYCPIFRQNVLVAWDGCGACNANAKSYSLHSALAW
jgi:hypothetical protein